MPVTVTLSIGIVNTPNYLILNVIKVKAPLSIVQDFVWGPNPSSLNIVVDNLDPENYWFDFRVSQDGIDPGVLVSRFLINAGTNKIIEEYRYYKAGGPRSIDPLVDDSHITDPYFVGKTITGIFKEGFRFLVPDDEWEMSADDTLLCSVGGNFQIDEIVTIIISYKGSTGSTGLPSDPIFKTIETNTTIDSDYYGAKIKLAPLAARLVVQFPAISSIPDFTTFSFYSRGGVFYQTKFIFTGADKVYYDGFQNTQELDEIWIGKGEFINFQVISGVLEVTSCSDSISKVGEKVIPGYAGHNNILLANMAKIDGNDYPRLYWYIKNCLPSNHKVISDAAAAADGVWLLLLASNGKRGQFGIDPTVGSKIFRMPYLQGMTERGLSDFSGATADTEGRTENIQGVFQPFMVGPHTHPYDPGDKGGQSDNANDRAVMIPDSPNPNKKSTGINKKLDGNNSTNNIVDNIGVLYGYRI